ncbi:MAG: hypothetical protein Q8P67_19985, partial [archaeon]|nr:hypothetical protein [archaeon]
MLTQLFGDEGDEETVWSADGGKLEAPEEPRSENHGFVGLKNQGSTCYLNSLLQTMYLTVPFRSHILGLTDEELGAAVLDEIDAEEAERLRQEEVKRRQEEAKAKQEGRGVAAGTTAAAPAKAEPVDAFKDDPSYEGVVTQLKEVGGFEEFAINQAIRASSGGLSNVEALMNWLFDYELPSDWEGQWAAEQKAIADRLEAEQQREQAAAALAAESGDSECANTATKRKGFRRIPLRLRQFFAELQMLDAKAVSTQPLTTSFGWKNNEVGVQQDIIELNNQLFDALHRSLRGTTGENLIPSLYTSETVSKIVCQNCGTTRDRPSTEPVIWAQVRGYATLPESLQGYVTPERLEGTNAYECSTCQDNGLGKQAALMGQSIRKLPDVLQFALSRFDVNWSTNPPSRIKLNSVLSFPLILDMHPYTEEQVALRIQQERERREEQKRLWLEKQARQEVQAISHAESSTSASEAVSSAETPTPTVESQPTAESQTTGESQPTGGRRIRKNNNNQQQGQSKQQQQQQQQGKKNQGKKKTQTAAAESAPPPPLPLFVADPAINWDSPDLYDLLSVVVHSGGAYGGHYYAYVADFAQEGIHPASSSSVVVAKCSSSDSCTEASPPHQGAWFEFNDSTVRPISVTELTQVYGGKGGCAYMLVYIRRNRSAAATPAQFPPPIPASLVARYSHHNQKLIKDREIYRQEAAKIEVKVYTLNLFKTEEETGKLYLRRFLEPPPPQEESANDAATTKTSRTAVEEEEEEEDGEEIGIMAVFAELEESYNAQTTAPEIVETLADGVFTIRIDYNTPLKDFLPAVQEALKDAPSFPGASARVDPMTIDYLGRVMLSPVLSELSNDQVRDSERTLRDIGLVASGKLLLWRGDEVDLTTFFNLKVHFYPPLTESSKRVPPPTPMALRIRDSATILDLKVCFVLFFFSFLS